VVYEQPRTSAEVDGRNGAALWPAAGDLEKAEYSLDLRAPVDHSPPKLGVITFCSKQVDTPYSPNDIRFVSQVTDYIALASMTL